MSEETPENESVENDAEEFEPEAMSTDEPTPSAGRERGLEAVMDVPVQLALQVGQTTLCIRDLLELVEGSVVELDRVATEPLDVLVNDRAVAKGEIVVVGDNFGVRLTSVIAATEDIQNDAA